MQITIRSIKDRRSFPVDAPPDALVEELKVKVEAASGIPASEQRLIFSGQTLREGALECAAELGRGDEQRARLHRRGRERKGREGEDLGADVAARSPLATLPHQAALPCS